MAVDFKHPVSDLKTETLSQIGQNSIKIYHTYQTHK